MALSVVMLPSMMGKCRKLSLLIWMRELPKSLACVISLCASLMYGLHQDTRFATEVVSKWQLAAKCA